MVKKKTKKYLIINLIFVKIECIHLRQSNHVTFPPLFDLVIFPENNHTPCFSVWFEIQHLLKFVSIIEIRPNRGICT